MLTATTPANLLYSIDCVSRILMSSLPHSSVFYWNAALSWRLLTRFSFRGAGAKGTGWVKGAYTTAAAIQPHGSAALRLSFVPRYPPSQEL